jgi:hypothetical protein
MPHYRIVNLVIYSASSHHERLMRRELERLTHRHVKRLFLSLSPECSEVHERDGTLYVPGTESFVPGILHKTLEALSYCARSLTFDFVVRSNVSTVVDFGRLLRILPRHSARAVYASTHIWELHAPDAAFASGTNIVLNAAAVEYVLSARSELRMDVIDDVALGILLRRVTAPQQLAPPMVWNDDSEASRGGVVFRNCSADRILDASRMAHIVDRILSADAGASAESRGAHPMVLVLIAMAALAVALALMRARR